MPSTWICDGNAATWRSDCLVASLDLSRPSDGLAALSIAGKTLPQAALLRVSADALRGETYPYHVEESYVRGGDLVVTEKFAAVPPEPYLRRQMYWRQLDGADLCGAAAGLDFVLSVNTGLLDARPLTLVTSTIPAVAGWQCPAESSEFAPLSNVASSATTFLLRLPDVPFALAQMIHSTDLTTCAARMMRSGEASLGSIEQRLFGDALEKGVILRGRIRVLLVPVDEAQDITLASRARFEKAPLPLTT